MNIFAENPRLALLLDHFGTITDSRQPWKVMYPLREVLLLVVCGTICGSCVFRGHLATDSDSIRPPIPI